MVGDLGAWEEGVWLWDLSKRRPLFVWESNLLNDILLVVVRHSSSDREDSWSWTLCHEGRYSVKSAYSHLLKGLPSSGAPEGDTLRAVSRVWKSRAPSKVVVFSWQLILDRIPTRLNLVNRGVPLLDGGLGCVFCDAPSESSTFPAWLLGFLCVPFSLQVLVWCLLLLFIYIYLPFKKKEKIIQLLINTKR